MRTRARMCSWFVTIASVALFVGSIGAQPVSSPADAGALSARAEYGITLALTGQYAEAESVFVSLLSLAPKDPSALTNLGNLHLVSGAAEVALVFYEQARRADSTDAGILLDRSIALLLLGEATRAQAEAASGLRLAGGLTEASSLLGLRQETEEPKPTKAEERPCLSKEEVLALLSAAAASVPIDSIAAGAAHDSTAENARGKHVPSRRPGAWRTAGLRAADQGELATILYWKRQ